MDIKQKVQHTYLFDPNEKIHLLARWETFRSDDIAQLEKVIDEYDAAFANLAAEYKRQVFTKIDAEKQSLITANKITASHAIDRFKSSLEPLFRPVPSHT